ncbi:MAG: hypothetical protein LBU07_00560 [Coriobacteriales bacterium]|jgi:hypothetical protein|nr:hypothetical protein [Coriobacteriales bacterium]
MNSFTETYPKQFSAAFVDASGAIKRYTYADRLFFGNYNDTYPGRSDILFVEYFADVDSADPVTQANLNYATTVEKKPDIQSGFTIYHGIYNGTSVVFAKLN